MSEDINTCAINDANTSMEKNQVKGLSPLLVNFYSQEIFFCDPWKDVVNLVRELRANECQWFVLTQNF